MEVSWIILYGLLTMVLIALVALTYRMAKAIQAEPEGSQQDSYILGQQIIYAAIVICSIAIAVLAFASVVNTPWEGHLYEWLNIIVRWMHITFGIAWIGTSFYFVFLENALNRTDNVRDELAGNMWSVHGGGFYYLEKYKVAPKEIPKKLHWFKYEAYFTWLSGFSLLFVVYYFQAKAFLIDPNVMALSPMEGIAIGVGSLLAGWVLYDLLCKSPLAKNKLGFALLGFVIAVGFAWFYTQVFAARAAYIHFGALLGTIMAANVFFTIIPGQKKMVAAAKAGKPVDPQLGKNAGLRSLHNNYFTLPVLFVMISNHFPSTFSHEHPWLILAAISLGSAGIKHYLNLREKGEQSIWVMPISILLLLGVAFVTAPEVKTGECNGEVTMTEIYPIFQNRCMTCHSSSPTDEVWTSPPNGVVYDTPADIARLSDKIMQRVVITETMPQNNKTGMLPAERELIRCWIEQGADVE